MVWPKNKNNLWGIMEKIDVKIVNIKDIKLLLLEGKVLNAASIVALYFHNQRYDI